MAHTEDDQLEKNLFFSLLPEATKKQVHEVTDPPKRKIIKQLIQEHFLDEEEVRRSRLACSLRIPPQVRQDLDRNTAIYNDALPATDFDAKPPPIPNKTRQPGGSRNEE